jgi:hypothetical protein
MAHHRPLSRLGAWSLAGAVLVWLAGCASPWAIQEPPLWTIATGHNWAQPGTSVFTLDTVQV